MIDIVAGLCSSIAMARWRDAAAWQNNRWKLTGLFAQIAECNGHHDETDDRRRLPEDLPHRVQQRGDDLVAEGGMVHAICGAPPSLSLPGRNRSARKRCWQLPAMTLLGSRPAGDNSGNVKQRDYAHPGRNAPSEIDKRISLAQPDQVCSAAGGRVAVATTADILVSNRTCPRHLLALKLNESRP
ncbi:hypothetical protein PE067_00010 [Paracoccus sp. DMF-8]|uniref:hypothetical protein n=1 Tax=Paracoccus sp. DMF-8 TaxID=3019445 RepID=UPI0023E8BC1A|nr:hypothetical protein [Paracoccus sp. DMF-8]MDF3604682.1 hypothetical protein [Paracoccus sp. DMF-8]